MIAVGMIYSGLHTPFRKASFKTIVPPYSHVPWSERCASNKPLRVILHILPHSRRDRFWICQEVCSLSRLILFVVADISSITEIRNIIYSFVLSFEHEIFISHRQFCPADRRSPFIRGAAGLMHTCRRIREEFSPLFWKGTSIWVMDDVMYNDSGEIVFDSFEVFGDTFKGLYVDIHERRYKRHDYWFLRRARRQKEVWRQSWRPGHVSKVKVKMEGDSA